MNSKDIIFIDELKIDTKIGVYAWEQDILQPVVIDIRLTTDITRAAMHDNLADTVNYQTIHDTIVDLVQVNRSLLLETLAENIATNILTNFPVNHVYLKLAKPGALKHAANVGIIIERSR